MMRELLLSATRAVAGVVSGLAAELRTVFRAVPLTSVLAARA